MLTALKKHLLLLMFNQALCQVFSLKNTSHLKVKSLYLRVWYDCKEPWKIVSNFCLRMAPKQQFGKAGKLKSLKNCSTVIQTQLCSVRHPRKIELPCKTWQVSQENHTFLGKNKRSINNIPLARVRSCTWPLYYLPWIHEILISSCQLAEVV